VLWSTGIVRLSNNFTLAGKKHDVMFIHHGFVLLGSVWKLLEPNKLSHNMAVTTGSFDPLPLALALVLEKRLSLPSTAFQFIIH
jgi:hypothetical protein